MDHDQRFKALLKEFFAEFFRLFFPEWAEGFDFSRVEWLDKEVYPDPPQGQRRSVDLVARVNTRQAVPPQRPEQEESWIALVHVEVEQRDSVVPLRPRMLDYYHWLRQRHGLPVLPIALYLRVGLDGIGTDVYEERFWERTLLRFEYQYVGLPALDALEYLSLDNCLGLALTALMKVPEEQKVWLREEALRRLYESRENTWRKYLLRDCVQAYLGLSEAQKQEFGRLVDAEPYEEVKAMTTTWFEDGIIQGRRVTLIEQLEQQFGVLSEMARSRIDSWSEDRLKALGLALRNAKTLQELGLED